MESPYASAPLNPDPSTPQFRLLELHPKTSKSMITCTLSSYSFDGCHPTYKALSYTWGPKPKLYTILLNGIQFYVSHNLWTFLKQMCSQSQSGFYWIDAICIDQENILEKNHQVQMMRRIYTTAERVVIWLGEANVAERSERAMDIIADSRSFWDTINQHAINCDLSDHWERLAQYIRLLFSRRYWTRIWIIQETIVAKNISVYCGSKTLEWQALVDFRFFVRKMRSPNRAYNIQHVYSLNNTEAMRLIYDRERKRDMQRQGTLAELLSYYKGCEASNVLDKVYALCGLASDADNVIIDYNISPKDLVVHLLDRTPHGWSEYDLLKFARTACEALGLDWTKDSFKELLNGTKTQETM